MGHFHNPIISPIAGATAPQPSTGPLKLPPSITAVPVNNPPFTSPGRTNLSQQEIAAIAQPDPWQYNLITGPEPGLQPYGQRKLPPRITAVPVNNPQPNADQLFTTTAIVQVWQPDPWLFHELGGREGQQPYGQRKLPPSITAVPVNSPIPNYNLNLPYPGLANLFFPPDPPPTLPTIKRVPAAVVTFVPSGPSGFLPTITNLAWQPPDPLPTLPGKLNPSITAVPVNNPPFANYQLTVSFLDPDPQPFFPQNKVAQPFVTTFVSSGPLGWLPTLTNLAWQPPDPQPTLQGKLNPSITAVPVNNPPFNQRVEPNQGLAVWQPPDPQPFVSYTGWQPLAPNKLNPTVTAVSVNNPPFSQRQEPLQGLTVWQPPDPQPFISYTGWQPLAPNKLNPSVTAVPVNNPPFSQRVEPNQGLAAWQPPDPSPFISYTGWQPLAPGKLNPTVTAVPVNNPPFSQRVEPLPGLNAWQVPDPPIQPPRYYPQQFVATTIIPFSNAWLAGVLTSWQPPDPSPTLPRNLPPQITAVPVNNPPFDNYQLTLIFNNVPLPPQLPTTKVVQPFVASTGQPFVPTWLSGVLTSWQPPDPLPTLPRNLPPQITAVPVNNPPFTQRDSRPLILSAWVPPDPQPTLPTIKTVQPFVSTTGQPFIPNWLNSVLQSWIPPDPQPTLQGKLNPSITAVPVNNPPGKPYPAIVVVDDPPMPIRLGPFFITVVTTNNPPFNQRLEPLPGLAAWQPPDPPPTLPGKLNPSITAVPVNNPPFSYAGRLAYLNNVIISWQPPDPPPVNRGPLPPTVLAVRTDNPPFTNRSRIENFNTMLAAWEIPLPPQPQQTKYIVTVIPPPPPVKELHDHPFFATFGKMTVH